MKNKIIDLFFKIDKRRIISEDENMTIQLCIMKVCEDLLNQYIHISKMNDEFFADNMVMYIEEKK